MKVTSREITLLVALITVSLLYLLYTFLFNPLINNLSGAREELAAAENRIIQVEQNYKDIPKLIKQQKELTIEAEKKVDSFIPDIKHDTITNFFAGTVAKGGPGISDIIFDGRAVVDLSTLIPTPYVPFTYAFEEWAKEAKGEDIITVQVANNPQTTPVLVQRLEVSFDNSTYEQIIAQMKAVEAINRTITVDSISISKEDDGTLSGYITYNFYGMEKISDEDKGLGKTPLNEASGKSNPFN